MLHGTATFELDPPDEAEMERRLARLAAGGFPYLVAEAAGAVAGYAYAGPYRDRPAYRFTVEDSVYMRDDCAGKGHQPQAGAGGGEARVLHGEAGIGDHGDIALRGRRNQAFEMSGLRVEFRGTRQGGEQEQRAVRPDDH